MLLLIEFYWHAFDDEHLCQWYLHCTRTLHSTRVLYSTWDLPIVLHLTLIRWVRTFLELSQNSTQSVEHWGVNVDPL